MHDSVYDVAGDLRTTRFLRRCLTALAGGPDQLLKELAQGVLAGEVDLRQAAAAHFYDDALGSALGRFQDFYSDLTDDERRLLVAEAESQLEEIANGEHLLNEHPSMESRPRNPE